MKYCYYLKIEQDHGELLEEQRCTGEAESIILCLENIQDQIRNSISHYEETAKILTQNILDTARYN